MEVLFLLAERIVHHVKDVFSKNNDVVDGYFFEKCLINDSSFDITFTNRETYIICSLSIHHLDMPWSLKVSIGTEVNRISLNKFVQETENRKDVYETYPNLLKDPNGLGNILAIEVAKDIVNYIKYTNKLV